MTTKTSHRRPFIGLRRCVGISGQSTLLKMAAGHVAPDRGHVRLGNMRARPGMPSKAYNTGLRIPIDARHPWTIDKFEIRPANHDDRGHVIKLMS